MLQKERQTRILSILQEKESVSIASLVDEFNCSRETIRRDMESLEKRGLITKVHGGAVLITPDEVLSSFGSRKVIHHREKIELAAKAMDFVEENSVIGVNAGTCTYFIACELRKKFNHLTVITNSLNVISELSLKRDYSIVVPGGILDHSEESLNGSIAENTLRTFHVDIAFISPGGISEEWGVTEFMNNELPIEKILLERADRAYIVGEHQKFDRKCMLKLCDFSQIKGIITDSQCPDDVVERYRSHGVDVFRADPL